MPKLITPPLALGVDLGGTKIQIILADAAGQAVAGVVRPTEAEKGLNQIMDNLLIGLEQVLQAGLENGRKAREIRSEVGANESVRQKTAKRPDFDALQALNQAYLRQGRKVQGLGLAVAGVLSEDRSVMHASPNLGLAGVPLRALLAEKTGLPVLLENDTNAAALGEYWYGAGQGQDPMVYIGLGTGVGGGLIIHGELYRGKDGGAGEIGHLVVEPQGPLCGQGHPGCLEAMVSGIALAREAQAAVARGRGARLLELAGGCGEKVTGPVIRQALDLGDATARELVQRAGAYLGMGLASVINLLNPALIVLGGGLTAGLGAPLLAAAQPEITLRAFPSLRKKMRIVLAGLEEDSAALGVAGLAHQHFA